MDNFQKQMKSIAQGCENTENSISNVMIVNPLFNNQSHHYNNKKTLHDFFKNDLSISRKEQKVVRVDFRFLVSKSFISLYNLLLN